MAKESEDGTVVSNESFYRYRPKKKEVAQKVSSAASKVMVSISNELANR